MHLTRIRCANGGAAVGPEDWLPATPWDRDFGDLFPTVGCTNLTCAACGEPVTHTLVAPYRRYRCACATRDVAAPVLFSGGASDLEEPLPPWSCAGHPRATLPLALDGVEVRDPADIDGLVRAALDREFPTVRPWPDAVDRPAYWLVRLAALLPDSLGVAIGQSVAEHLTSDDPLRTRGAWEFFHHLPGVPGAEHVCAAFLARRAWLATVLDPVVGKTPLHTYAIHTLERRLTVSDDALAALRVGALDGTHPHHGLFTLGRRDAAWLAAHGDAYLTANPGHVRTLASALAGQQDEVLADALARFAGRGVVERAQVLAALAELPAGVAERVRERVHG